MALAGFYWLLGILWYRNLKTLRSPSEVQFPGNLMGGSVWLFASLVFCPRLVLVSLVSHRFFPCLSVLTGLILHVSLPYSRLTGLTLHLFLPLSRLIGLSLPHPRLTGLTHLSHDRCFLTHSYSLISSHFISLIHHSFLPSSPSYISHFLPSVSSKY